MPTVIPAADILAALPILKRAFPGRTTEEWLALATGSPETYAAELARATSAADGISIDTLVEGRTVSDTRREDLAMAIALGADLTTLENLRDAVLVSRKAMILLPQGKYEGLSRGKGWARKGRRDSAEWGERDGNGYRVGPGRWTVGSTDGFSRKSQAEWVVVNLPVGDQTWTVAD